MRRLLVALAPTLVLAAACSVGGPSTDTPEGAMAVFLDAVDAGDCEAVRDVALTPSELDCTMVDGYQALFVGLDPDDAEISQTSRDGSSAVVEVTWPSGSSELEAQRVDGVWKIVLDSAA